MATVFRSSAERGTASELCTGDRMTREEFHRVYAETPDDFRAELIGGIVYVSSPLRRAHGTTHVMLGGLLFAYQARTPGVEAGDNATILLGEEAEPQPDLYLRILAEFGGRSRTTAGDYVSGPPELIIEIAHSRRAIDLHAKKDDYGRYGVLEYLVASPAERQVWWFDLATGAELPVDPDGLVRVRAFPGLWIRVDALLAGDASPLLAALDQGLASPGHADFVTRLATGRT